jgi:hypothetical protein
MTTPNRTPTRFAGTYFDRDSVLRLARLTEIFAWVFLGFYAVQLALSLLVFLLQIGRGLISIAGPTDWIQQVLWLVQPALPGLWWYVGMQAVGKALLIFMDVEDNTRRAAG